MKFGYSRKNEFHTYVILDQKIREIMLPSRKEKIFDLSRSRKADELASMVNEWIFEGKVFYEEYHRWGTPFGREVCKIVEKIPKGKVMSYQEVAKKIGSKAFRAVGGVMAKNPIPLLIPCHRVIRSDRTLGGYGGGVWMKRQILELEGVEFGGEKVKKEFLL
ncbi:MAG: methylated-DNA--[protein]-cysteine S-methyltransferase [Candidatus Methanofastidiosia archaeon]